MSEVLQDFKDHGAVQSLIALHEDMHHLAKKLILLRQQNQAQQALKDFGKIEHYREKITEKLNALLDYPISERPEWSQPNRA
jgi:hypothetical protein